MHALVHAADVQDRDGGALLMASLFGAFPFLLKLYADGGYQGREFQAAVKKALGRVNVEIVKRSDQATGFFVLPKRWIVNVYTMLPVRAFSGHRSSNAGGPTASGTDRADRNRGESICRKRIRGVASFDGPSAARARAHSRWRRGWSCARIALCWCGFRSMRRG